MKYLDEKGVKYLWEKVQELSFSGGGGSGGGEGTLSYYEKTYNTHGFNVTNPMYNNTITEKNFLEANKVYSVYQNEISIGEMTVKEMSQQELAVLSQVLASFGSPGFQFTKATYITDVSNWMGLLDNSLFGFILITASTSISGVQTDIVLYFTNTKAEGEERFTIKDTIKIPAKKFYEPVLLWEGVSNTHTDLILNDNATKFRYLALMVYNNQSETDMYPRVLFSPIVENVITCFYSTGTFGTFINGNVKNPHIFQMTNTSNINSIDIKRIYGLY